MYDVMQGVRVVEVAEHTFVPAAAMILADWGADVIKIERAAGGGDMARHMRAVQRPGLKSPTRSSRRPTAASGASASTSRRPRAASSSTSWWSGADVFITNMRDDARVKMGIEPERPHGPQPAADLRPGHGLRPAGPHGRTRGFDLPVLVVPLGLGLHPDAGRRRAAAQRSPARSATWAAGPRWPAPSRRRCSGGSAPGRAPWSTTRST